MVSALEDDSGEAGYFSGSGTDLLCGLQQITSLLGASISPFLLSLSNPMTFPGMRPLDGFKEH